MPPNCNHALRNCVKVSFMRKSQDMLDDCQIKSSCVRPVFQVFSPDIHFQVYCGSISTMCLLLPTWLSLDAALQCFRQLSSHLTNIFNTHIKGNIFPQAFQLHNTFRLLYPSLPPKLLFDCGDFI